MRILTALLFWWRSCRHQNRRVVSSPVSGKLEYWCPDCNIYWLEDV